MSLVLNESMVLAKTRSQDLKSVLKLNCWGSNIKDVSLVRKLINVEVIGLSCNEITTLEDFAHCQKLRELILRKNKIKNISEIAHLQSLPKLTSLWLGENPCAETTHNYRKVVLKALPNLTVLDNIPVTREELQEIEELGNEIYEEVPYESTNSTGSGSSSNQATNQTSQQPVHQKPQPNNDNYENDSGNQVSEQTSNYGSNENASYNAHDASFYQPNDTQQDDLSMTAPQNGSLQMNQSSRLSNFHHQRSRCLSSQGSMTGLNGQHQSNGFFNSYNNNNNNSARCSRSRHVNILSAVLCLIKELDYAACEVVENALHCRMEETSQ